MENDFRNLTAKVWANLDNPIKSYDFSKFWLISCMPPSQVPLCCNLVCRPLRCHFDVTTVQLSNATVHKFLKNLTFYEKISSLYFLYFGYVIRAKMIVHVFMIELDQPDYWYPRKIKNCENLCTKSMESCSPVASQILAEFRPERATFKTLHK